MINGKWQENITCPKCKHRHPAGITCADAELAAASAAVERDAHKALFSEPSYAELIEDLRRQLAEREQKIDDLIDSRDLAKYRASK